MAIQLSEAAAKEIKTIIQQQELPSEKTRLRVGVKGGGCSGFSYLLDLTEEDPADTDEQMESHGVPILVDNKSLLYPRRRRDRLPRRGHGPRVRLQEPQCDQLVRLRQQLQRLIVARRIFLALARGLLAFERRMPVRYRHPASAFPGAAHPDRALGVSPSSVKQKSLKRAKGLLLAV